MKRGKRRGLGALGEAAHAAQIFVGRSVNDPRSKAVVRELSDREVIRLATLVARRMTGAATVLDAKGRYVDMKDGKAYPVEKTAVIQTVVPSRLTSCAALIRRAQKAGGRLAQLGRQQSVLVEVSCADGTTDAALVDRRGKVHAVPGELASEKSRRRKRRR